MEFVTEWIAIGDRFDARNIKALKEADIQAVLCVADWVRMPRKKYQEAGITCYKLPIADRKPLPEEMEEAFLAALCFVDANVSAKRRCLIHCAMGISRSAAFIAVWLHTRMGMDYDEALSRIKRVRPIIEPQPEPFASMRKLIKREGFLQLARRMAEECPAVPLADCPNHEGHQQECYERGKADGFEAAIEFIKKMLDEGKYKNFEEFHDHHAEGQIAT